MASSTSFGQVSEAVDREWGSFLTKEDRQNLFTSGAEFFITSVRYSEVKDKPVIYYSISDDLETWAHTLTFSSNDFRALQAGKVEEALRSTERVGPVVLVQGPVGQGGNPRWELAEPGQEAPSASTKPGAEPDIDPDDIPF